MSNEEILNKLIQHLDIENNIGKQILVTDIISTFYDIKHNANNALEAQEEYDYERRWWRGKYGQLINKIEVK